MENIYWTKQTEGVYKMEENQFVEVYGTEAANKVDMSRYTFLECDRGRYRFKLRVK